MKKSRRVFIKKVATGTGALSLGGVLSGVSAKSYNSILGSNERIKLGVMGVNSRGLALATNFAYQKNCEVIRVSDVDRRAAEKCINEVTKIQNSKPNSVPDFRNALNDKEVDAMVIATPDHWHAPAAILACSAGKNVYLEKPGSYNPEEGEMLMAAVKKNNTVLQMGFQRRSYPNVREAIDRLHDGIIGRIYFAKGFYASNRQTIGHGKKAAVPEWLNYDLWQGPAPRKEYIDNLIHYNWHWRWHWGTGEMVGNGCHFMDLALWGLQMKHPNKVNSTGGRYRYDDDWETPDTQIMVADFDNESSVMWEARSCNGFQQHGAAVGIIYYGEAGALYINGNAYTVYDLKNNVLEKVESNIGAVSQDRRNPSQALDSIHFQNFFDGIRKGSELHAGVESGIPSTNLCHLGNIAYRYGSTLNINSKDGTIKNKDARKRFWGRKYEPGWKPVI